MIITGVVSTAEPEWFQYEVQMKLEKLLGSSRSEAVFTLSPLSADGEHI